MSRSLARDSDSVSRRNRMYQNGNVECPKGRRTPARERYLCSLSWLVVSIRLLVLDSFLSVVLSASLTPPHPRPLFPLTHRRSDTPSWPLGRPVPGFLFSPSVTPITRTVSFSSGDLQSLSAFLSSVSRPSHSGDASTDPGESRPPDPRVRDGGTPVGREAGKSPTDTPTGVRRSTPRSRPGGRSPAPPKRRKVSLGSPRLRCTPLLSSLPPRWYCVRVGVVDESGSVVRPLSSGKSGASGDMGPSRRRLRTGR